jgi:hypothetical protein
MKKKKAQKEPEENRQVHSESKLEVRFRSSEGNRRCHFAIGRLSIRIEDTCCVEGEAALQCHQHEIGISFQKRPLTAPFPTERQRNSRVRPSHSLDLSVVSRTTEAVVGVFLGKETGFSQWAFS